jgi:excisionase family DNA binding protein
MRFAVSGFRLLPPEVEAAASPFLTIPQTAAYLGVSIETVRRYVKSGVLTSHKLPPQNGKYLIERRAIETMLSGEALS